MSALNRTGKYISLCNLAGESPRLPGQRWGGEKDQAFWGSVGEVKDPSLSGDGGTMRRTKPSGSDKGEKAHTPVGLAGQGLPVNGKFLHASGFQAPRASSTP